MSKLMKKILHNKISEKVGESVVLQGWVHARRDMGKIIFIDFRDSTGFIQLVFVPGDTDSESLERVKGVRNEFVLEVEGVVQKRSPKQVNPNIINGEVEVLVKKVSILSEAKTPPFELDKDTRSVNDELRLKYRYLDLRSERMQKNLKIRSEFIQKCREYLFKNSFTEIETPLLTASTLEGSRDFIIPSRIHPGKFYALPQSPQQYKQLLMMAGLERYFQIARCIRDEDLRADRGFEHTQIDIEMSFVEMNDIMSTIESMVIEVVEAMGHTIKEKPFPRISFKVAMEKYGADKFDLRTEEEKQQGILAYAWVVDFPFFEPDGKDGWTFTHNPFSMPKPDHIEWLLKGEHIPEIITQQYDLVCNGFESGGGSIRAHNPEILRATYKIMGYEDERIEKSIGHMLEAFQYGAPPHGGIALGVERNIMNLTSESYLREVQAFPMTGGGQTAVMQGPASISEEDLKELGLSLIHDPYSS